MDSIHALLLALVQGLTEFLPISSTGHLILVPALLGWPDQGLGFDIAVHVGTLAAVLAYFRRELAAMTGALLEPRRPEARLAWAVVLGSAPLALGGWLFADAAEGVLRSPAVIAAATGGFGVALWVADRAGRGARAELELGWADVLLIGCGQALALIPGTSRAGITITVGLALGLSRQAASRFSFLLAIPAIVMAAGWQAWRFGRDPEPVVWSTLALATVVASVAAFLTIGAFLRLVERLGMGVFALYRLVLAGVIAYAYV